MRLVITFGGAGYDRTTHTLVQNAKRFGADDVWVYDDKWLLGTEFGRSDAFRWLLTHQGVGNPYGGRGFGWFAWKPYVMSDALSRCADGDTVLFLDADTYPIRDFGMLYDECERIGGLMFFRAEGCSHDRWCKRDCFIAMGMDEPRWRQRQHGVARFFLAQKGRPGVTEFFEDWQRWCLDPRATTFEPSVLAPEHPEFHEHRTEQAIMTNLCHARGLKLYREACQFGKDQPEDQELYPQLFEQVYCGGEKTREGSKHFHVPGVSR